MGTLALGWSWLRIAQAAESRFADGGGDAPFYEGKLATARYCAARALTGTAGLRQKVEAGAETLMAMPLEAFTRA